MQILHIINGDCALAGWLAAGFTGEVLVWRENYLQGFIPDTCDIATFNRIRAGELHKLLPEKPEADIFSELQKMHKTLLAMKRTDKLILWLDCCPFDKALKKRLLELIASMAEKPEVYLVEQDVIWNEKSFAKYKNWQDYPCLI